MKKIVYLVLLISTLAFGSGFLEEIDNFGNIVFSKGDYKAWAKGLRAAGYATDPKYPDKLISYIERYHLHQYDNQILDLDYVSNEKQLAEELSTENRNSKVEDIALYEVQKGDTLYSISKKYNIPVEELKRQNNLLDNAISVGQTILIKN